MNFDQIMHDVPALILVLAGTGIAALAYLTGSFVVKVFDFLFANRRSGVTATLVLLIVVGGGLRGWKWDDPNGSNNLMGAGLTSVVIGSIVLALYWIRQWVKWCNNEKD